MKCPHCGEEIKFKGTSTGAERAIEMYYRRRAAGGRVTMTAIAKEAGYNRTYLSEVKAEYDRAGKWGSAGSGKVIRRVYRHKKATP